MDDQTGHRTADAERLPIDVSAVSNSNVAQRRDARPHPLSASPKILRCDRNVRCSVSIANEPDFAALQKPAHGVTCAASALAMMPAREPPIRLNAPIVPPRLRHLFFWLAIETGRPYRHLYCPTYVTPLSSRESSAGGARLHTGRIIGMSAAMTEGDCYETVVRCVARHPRREIAPRSTRRLHSLPSGDV